MRSNIINFWKKPTKRNIVKNHHREGSKEIEGVQKQIIIEERGGWLKRRDTRREEEGNENSAYDEKRRRSAWSRKREREGGIVKNSKLCIRAKSKNVPLESLYRWNSTLLDRASTPTYDFFALTIIEEAHPPC